MTYRRSLTWLALFLVMSITLTWIIFGTLSRGVAGSSTSYSAVFTDVSGLHPGDDVRVAGVRVGRVDAVELDGTLARVRFRIESDQTLSGDTKAAVIYQNIIGQRYLGLSLGEHNTPQALDAGAEIPVEHTEPSFDISALLNGFQPLFGVLDPDKVNNMTNAIIGALQGDTASVTRLLEQTSEVAEAVAGPDQILGEVITNLGNAISGLSNQTSSLQDVITRSQSIFEALSARRAELVESVDTISTVGTRMSQIAADTRPDITAFVARQPGFSTHFNENKAAFDYLGSNVPLLLKGLARVSQEGSFLSAYVCDLDPLGFAPFLAPLVPGLVAAATPGAESTYSPMCQS